MNNLEMKHPSRSSIPSDHSELKKQVVYRDVDDSMSGAGTRPHDPKTWSMERD